MLQVLGHQVLSAVDALQNKNLN